jgi:hypothetical protein
VLTAPPFRLPLPALGGLTLPLSTAGTRAIAAGRFSVGSCGMTSMSLTISVISSALLNCTRYLLLLMVRMMPSCSWRVTGCRATTAWPTLSGRGTSGGTSMPTPTSSYFLRVSSLRGTAAAQSMIHHTTAQ